MGDLFGGALPVPLAAQIAEVRREIVQRERVYPRFVAAGKLTQGAADRQIGAMRAVLATLAAAAEDGALAVAPAEEGGGEGWLIP